MDFFRKLIFFKRYSKTIPLSLQLRLLKRLYKLLDNGYSLLDSLKLIALEEDLKTHAKTIETHLIKGSSFANALKKSNFNILLSNFLVTVERSGNLKEHILTSIQIVKQRLSYQSKIRQVIRYPLVLAIIFAGLFFFINSFVLPSFSTIIITDNQALSNMNIFIQLIKVFGGFFLVIIILSVTLFLLRKHFKRVISVSQRVKLLQKTPLLRSFATLQTTFLFSTQLSTLLQSGMNFKKVLHHLSNQTQMPIISHYSSLLIKEFVRGGNIPQLLQKLPLIDQQLAILFQNNTNTLELAKDLNMYEEIIFDEFERKIMRLVMLIQPIFFSFLAIFIVGMYMAIMWPMFDLINNI